MADRSSARMVAGFYVLLACTLALSVEESVHLAYHPQGWPPDNVTLLHHPGCTVQKSDSRVLRCPVDGYNSALFFCSDIACRMKEPANGVGITPSEETILHVYMRKRSKAERLAEEPNVEP